MDLNKKLSEARAKREKLVADARALMETADNETRDMTDAEQTQFNDLHGQAERMLGEISTIETQIEAERAAAAKSFGKVDRELPAVSIRYGQLRAFKSEESAYRAGMWARAWLLGDQKAQRWCNDHDLRAMGEGIFTKGGAVVPEEFSQAVIDLREQYGVARRLARVVPMGSDTLILPRRTGGVTAYFVGENVEITASDKSWDQVQLTAKKLAALTRLSREYAEDAVINVAEDLASEMAYAFAEKEDDCFFNGTGTSAYGGIVGVRTKIIDGNHTAGAKDAASGHDTFAEIDADDLATVMAALPVFAEMGAQWVISQPGKALVFDALAAAAGGNTIQIMGERPRPAYLGYPIVVSQKMPTATTDISDTAMILFGDFSKSSIIGDRRGFTVQVLNERYAEYDQIGIVATERMDIVHHDLGSTTAAGPVVALIGE